ncbi:MAG: hypothetical protein K940chlam9_01311 [Chlamydiae bacterium]|nr:hypothetical protein [Chlamydiota bacterium]
MSSSSSSISGSGSSSGSSSDPNTGILDSVTIESGGTGEEGDIQNPSVKEQIEGELGELQEQSQSWSLCAKVSKATTSLIIAGGTGTVSFFQSSWIAPSSLLGRVAGIALPFSSGAALEMFFSSILPANVMRRIRIEAWRMGIPIYFLLTEIYLNLYPDESSEGREQKESIISVMTILAGFQVASWVDGIVRSQFGNGHGQGYSPVQGEMGGSPLATKKFKLVGESSSAYFLTRELTYFAIGSGLMVSSYYLPFVDPKVTHMEFNFGVFYIGEAITLPLARQLIKWGEGLEEKYAQRLEANALLEVPRNLQNWRIAKKLISFWGPVGTYSLFIAPDWYTLGPAGALHGIEEELRKSLFAHRPVSKVEGVRKKYFDNQMKRDGLRVARLITELGGLGYFMYKTVGSDTPIDYLIGGCITGSAVLGYNLSFWVDRKFSVEESSSFMQNLFYRFVYSDSILGIDLLLPYWYIFNKGIDIGTADLSSLNNFFLALIYICYGGRAGRDMAVLDTDRDDPVVPRISKWLLANNIILLYDIASKKVD